MASMLIVCAAICARPAPAETTTSRKATRLLILNLKSSEAWAPFAADVTEQLVTHIAALGKPQRIYVQSEADIALSSRVLREQADLSKEDCRNLEACLARIAAAAESDKILRSSVRRLGDSFVGLSSLIDAHGQGVDDYRSCIGETPEEFTQRFVEMVGAMLGLSGDASLMPEEPPPEFGKNVFVVPLTASEDQKEIGEALTQIFSEEIHNYKYSSIVREEQLEVLQIAGARNTLQNSERALDEVVAEIVGARGVEYVATGGITQFDQTYLIALKLIRLADARVVHRIVEHYRGERDYLPLAMRFATARLFQREPSNETGALEILTDLEGTYRIDRGKSEPLPRQTPISGLSATKHQVTISVTGHYQYNADFYLHGPTLRLRPKLEALPREWYESPLVWSIAGIAVAGAATAIFIAAMPSGGPGDVDHQ